MTSCKIDYGSRGHVRSMEDYWRLKAYVTHIGFLTCPLMYRPKKTHKIDREVIFFWCIL